VYGLRVGRGKKASESAWVLVGSRVCGAALTWMKSSVVLHLWTIHFSPALRRS